jgi:hypothetical protein
MPVVTASYPQQIPVFTDKFDLIDAVFADHINSLQREVAALATVIGTLPAGVANTVRERVEAIEASIADINSRFTATQTVPQSSVDGLTAALSTLTGQIVALQAALNSISSQVTALQSQKPEASQVVQVTGAQYIYGLKMFQALVRMLATQLYSADSTNHAWEIGVSGGRVIKFDYTGFGAYDGSGPAEMVLQRDGGEVYYGGGIRAAGMVGIAVDSGGPFFITEPTYVAGVGTPVLSLRVPQSGRVMVHMSKEATVASGEARMSVALSGVNTLVADDIRSTVVSSPTPTSASRSLYLTGLTPGSTTFTSVFRSSDSVSAGFSNVSLHVVPVL